VSDEFKNISQIEAHKKIYKVVENEMGEKKDNKLHALSIVAKSCADWDKNKSGSHISKSPKCLGGDDKKI
jgi:acid stress-induced BolA-like protein IbaG/YrbA